MPINIAQFFVSMLVFINLHLKLLLQSVLESPKYDVYMTAFNGKVRQNFVILNTPFCQSMASECMMTKTL